MNRDDKLLKLSELLEIEHGGCDDTTCSIQVAANNGYDVHAFDCFASSGAASDEFYKLWNSIGKKWREKESRLQASEMCDHVSHKECSHCGATIWEFEVCANWCSSCGEVSK